MLLERREVSSIAWCRKVPKKGVALDNYKALRHILEMYRPPAITIWKNDYPKLTIDLKVERILTP